MRSLSLALAPLVSLQELPCRFEGMFGRVSIRKEEAAVLTSTRTSFTI